MKPILLALLLITFFYAPCQTLYTPGGAAAIVNNGVNSNVGIGISVPEYKLDIESTENYKQLRIKAPGAPLMKFSGAYNNGNGAELFQEANGMFRINTNSDRTAIAVTTDGYVGIGTASPGSRLTLNQSSPTGEGAQTSEITIQSNLTNVARFGWNAGGYVDIQALYNNNHIVLTPDGTGKVGIGTTSPVSLLTLNRGGTGVQSSEMTIQSNTVNVARFGWNAGGYVDISALYNHDHIVLSPSGNGKVGIGTTTPELQLHLKNPDGGSALGLERNGKLWRFDLDYQEAQKLYIGHTDKTDVLVLTRDGRMGMGTQHPDATLTVKGDIHTNEVRVDMDWPIQGPDYVFEKDYNLLPLAELEAYINQNKHLPEVPSAKEMAVNGLNLKEMNLLLLKKVEELTLHLIEMKKENEEQSRINSLQQKEIEQLKIRNK
jgi:hypothetical protein